MLSAIARHAVAILAVSVLSLAACADTDSDLAVEQAETGDVAPVMDVEVEEVTLGRAMDAQFRITDSSDEFAPSDSIYASVKTEGTANAATITARWTTDDDAVLHEETKTLSSAGEQWTSFSFVRSAPLQEGEYELHILLNGREVQEKDFTIDG